MKTSFFQNGLVNGETFLFSGETAEAKLAFKPAEIVEVYNDYFGVTYEAGRDYTFDSADGKLLRTKDSRIPFMDAAERYPALKESELYPAANAKGIGMSPVSPTGYLVFSGSDLFLRKQTTVTYRTKEVAPVIETADGKLPRFAELVRAHKTVNLTFLGDSITDGWNASGKVGCPPYATPYAGRIAARIAQRTPCRFCNAAVSGSCSHAGLEHLESALKRSSSPDLFFIAYGMNELKNSPPEVFREKISGIIRAIREKVPQAEIVLVSQMRANPEWEFTPAGNETVFANILRELADQPWITYAPVNELWLTVMEHKDFLDVTGNGVNHPNDFGHTIYEAAVSAVLTSALQ